jgi:hypothetical protein
MMINDTTIADKVFKIVILAFLIFSILIQITVSVWFHEKLKNLENRLSLYPVNKPAEVDLRVTIPKLVEIDGKIDKLAQELDKVVRSPRTPAVSQTQTKAEHPPKSNNKKAKPRKSTQVDVVEKIGN